MSRRICSHLRSNVVGYVALFIALTSGTAYALNGSNTVFSDDIVNGEVKNPDLADNSVSTTKIADGGVLAPDLGANAVTTRKILNGDVRGVDLGANAVDSAKVADDSIGGDDVAESTLGQVPSALLGGFGRTGTLSGTCNPESETFVTCASVNLDLPTPTRVLVLGRITAAHGKSDFSNGTCALATAPPGGPVPNTVVFKMLDADEYTDDIPLVGITDVLPAGPTLFALDCNEDSTGDPINYTRASVTAVALSPS
jgi:hypothetical protein